MNAILRGNLFITVLTLGVLALSSCSQSEYATALIELEEATPVLPDNDLDPKGQTPDGDITGIPDVEINEPDPSGCISNCGPSVPGEQVDRFTQSEKANKKVNFIFTLDNSQSMEDDITAVGENFKEFTDYLIGDDGIEFKIKATTSDARETGDQVFGKFNETDGYYTTANGKYYFLAHHETGMDMTRGLPFNSDIAKNEPGYFRDLMESLFTMASGFPGTESLPPAVALGSGQERMLEATTKFVRLNEEYIEEDAHLAVVLISDEAEQSAESARGVIDLLRSYKGGHSNNKIMAFSFIQMQYENTDYGKIVELADGGLVKPIADMAENLNNLGSYIKDALLYSFFLSKKPLNVSEIEVKVDGELKVQGSHYTYDSSSNSVKFEEGFVPEALENISVKYKFEK